MRSQIVRFLDTITVPAGALTDLYSRCWRPRALCATGLQI